MMFNINTCDCPEIPGFNFKWNFKCISSTNSILFFHIRKGKPNSRLSVFDSNLEMNTEIFLRGCKEFYIKISSNKIGIFDFAVWIRDGDCVIRENRA